MPSNLLEPPPAVLTREDIVTSILEHFQSKIDTNKLRIAQERRLLSEPCSETDRDEKAEHRRLVLNTIDTQEADQANNVAFSAWLERQCHIAEDPLAPGNIWVMKADNERMIWMVYDPNAVRPGMEAYVTIGDAELQARLGVDQISTLSVNCPLYLRLVGKDFREGVEIEIGVEGNDPEILRLEQIL